MEVLNYIQDIYSFIFAPAMMLGLLLYIFYIINKNEKLNEDYTEVQQELAVQHAVKEGRIMELTQHCEELYEEYNDAVKDNHCYIDALDKMRNIIATASADPVKAAQEAGAVYNELLVKLSTTKEN